jgi:methylated-DNA-[protein]-cysteine S-methyltransferase
MSAARQAVQQKDARAGATAWTQVDSPVGTLVLGARDSALVRVKWGSCAARDETPLLQEAARQLAAYFAGERTTFDLPLAPEGTSFQRQVYAAMAAIPYGATRSYGEIAAELDGIARAVGSACGSNPLPLVIPCHRVLAGGGKLGGFSGGSSRETALETKRWLLLHEGALQPDRQMALF